MEIVAKQPEPIIPISQVLTEIFTEDEIDYDAIHSPELANEVAALISQQGLPIKIVHISNYMTELDENFRDAMNVELNRFKLFGFCLKKDYKLNSSVFIINELSSDIIQQNAIEYESELIRSPIRFKKLGGLFQIKLEKKDHTYVATLIGHLYS